MTYIKINTMNKYNITYYSKFKYNYTYCIICTNKKSKFYMNIYFGKHSTNNILDGYIGSGIKINKYIKKYPNDFYKVILSLYSNEYELNKAEYDLIHPHLNKYYCLNLAEGGQNNGLSEESKQKISIAHKGKHLSEETKQKLREINIGNTFRRGKKCSTEAIEKNRLAHLGKKMKPFTEDHKRKISESNKGKKKPELTEEHKQKLSIALKGKKKPEFTKEHRKHISESHLGKKRKPLSEETKKKMSEARKGKHLSEETKQKLREINIGRKAPIKGKHRVWDNKELNIYHYE